MRAKKATTLISFLAPSAAFSFCVLPHRKAQHAQQQQRCTRSIFSDRLPQGCTCSSAIDPKRGGRGRARLADSRPSCSQHVVMAATAGKPDTAAAAATTGDTPAAAAAGSSSRSRNPRQRVSRALNRALGNVLATGDMFGRVSNGVSDGKRRRRCPVSHETEFLNKLNSRRKRISTVDCTFQHPLGTSRLRFTACAGGSCSSSRINGAVTCNLRTKASMRRVVEPFQSEHQPILSVTNQLLHHLLSLRP